jgi:hypothetical protein
MQPNVCLGLLAAIGLAAVAGCGSKTGAVQVVPPTARNHQEAGTSHVSVISVAHWSDYVDALQPRFTLTESDALMAAEPLTMRYRQQLNDALAARAGIALPRTETTSERTSVTSAETRDDTTTVEEARTTSRTDSRRPGSVAGVEAGDPLPLPGAIGSLAGELLTNPMARYWSATALFQEVNLLSRYVADAAFDYSVEPYVVRLQVSLQPRQRGQALDAYATFSFAAQRPEPRAGFESSRDLSDVSGLGFLSLGRLFSGGQPVLCGPDPDRPIKVVPILVTDNLEAASGDRASTVLREYGLALSAMAQGVGLSGSVAREIQNLEAVLGRDANSLLTVSRVTDDSLRARFGAAFQARTGLAMIPRNHTVTVLLLVPRSTVANRPCPLRRTELVTTVQSEFVNAVTGVKLADRTHSETVRVIQQMLVRLGIPATVPEDARVLEQMLYAVGGSKSGEFDRLLASLPGATEENGGHRALRPAVWHDLVDIVASSRLTGAVFTVPEAPFPVVPLLQLVELVDDGERGVVRLDVDRYTSASPLVARARVTNRTTRQSAYLPSVSMSPAPGGGRVQFTFESATKLGLCPPLTVDETTKTLPTSPCDVSDFQVFHRPRRKDDEAGPWPISGVSYRAVSKPAPPKPKFEMAVPTKVLVADPSGRAAVRVEIRSLEGSSPLVLNVSGADVEEASAAPSAALRRGAKGWEVTAAGIVTFRLGNVVGSVNVTIVGTQGGAEQSVTVTPVAAVAGK